MTRQVPFIGREEEFVLIEQLIRERGTFRVLCFEAPGGYGKTRLLQEIHIRYSSDEQTNLIVADIIDFDDHHFYSREYVVRKIAQMLGEKGFDAYLKSLNAIHKMQKAGAGFDQLGQEYLKNSSAFIKCFNEISEQKRVVLSFDTTEALKRTDFWGYIAQIGKNLKNTLIIIAGRDTKSVELLLRKEFSEEIVSCRKLSPLIEEAGKEYLNKKQELLHIIWEPELAQKLLLLSGGIPILIDLAAEWRMRGISLDWLAKESVGKIQSFHPNELEKKQRDFERELVIHLTQIRTKTDALILLMSRVYPVNANDPLHVGMIAKLLNSSEQETEKLLADIQTYIFVKTLPDQRLTLHDEMRRLIHNYVWPEVDSEGNRRIWDSKTVISCLEEIFGELTGQMNQLEQDKKIADEKGQTDAVFEISSKQEVLEQDIWAAKEQYLHHVLSIDVNQGTETFIEMFDNARKTSHFSFRGMLLAQMEQLSSSLSNEQRYELNIRQMGYWLDVGQYLQANALAGKMLANGAGLTPAQQIDLLILHANVYIRQGDVGHAIANFKEAVKISKANEFTYKILERLGRIGNITIHLRNIKETTSAFKKAVKIDDPKQFVYKVFYEFRYHLIETFSLLKRIQFKGTKKKRTFQEKEKVQDMRELARYRIKALNGLGYAYRLTGNLKQAQVCYREARRKCLLEGGLYKKELMEDFGWISNNLAFALSRKNQTRRTAIDLAGSTLEHWRKTGNKIGLGACYSMLGAAHYRSGHYERALEAFQHALDILKPLEFNERLAQTYSRRGAVYRHLKNFEQAEKDLKLSLEIGTEHIKPMTLNRLGRLYMAQKKWGDAETCMKESLEYARSMPDYVYWLSSVARLIAIAGARGEYHRFEEFHKMLQNSLAEIKNPDAVSLGIAYLELARLAFGQHDTAEINTLLRQGITLIIEDESYERIDILKRLSFVEQDFDRLSPEIIRTVGKSVQRYISRKESKKIVYTIVTPMISRWANWQ